MGPVFLSTTEDGKVVRGLGGIPSEGPVLLVGNHMLLASDKISLPGQFVHERNINLRPLVHPMMFTRLRDGLLPDVSVYDMLRMMGSVPISGTHLHNLLSAKSHILLFPGGIREALHRKVSSYILVGFPEWGIIYGSRYIGRVNIGCYIYIRMQPLCCIAAIIVTCGSEYKLSRFTH